MKRERIKQTKEEESTPFTRYDAVLKLDKDLRNVSLYSPFKVKKGMAIKLGSIAYAVVQAFVSDEQHIQFGDSIPTEVKK